MLYCVQASWELGRMLYNRIYQSCVAVTTSSTTTSNFNYKRHYIEAKGTNGVNFKEIRSLLFLVFKSLFFSTVTITVNKLK
jgi:hypothetical protein